MWSERIWPWEGKDEERNRSELPSHAIGLRAWVLFFFFFPPPRSSVVLFSNCRVFLFQCWSNISETMQGFLLKDLLGPRLLPHGDNLIFLTVKFLLLQTSPAPSTCTSRNPLETPLWVELFCSCLLNVLCSVFAYAMSPPVIFSHWILPCQMPSIPQDSHLVSFSLQSFLWISGLRELLLFLWTLKSS